VFFPSEFESADPGKIRGKFREPPAEEVDDGDDGGG
jgi:hypothetical protein